MSSGHRMGHDLLAYTLQDGALIPDPGDNGQIEIDRSFGICLLTIGSDLETRTLPDPTSGPNGIGLGTRVLVVVDTEANGSANLEGVTFNTAGQFAEFIVASVGGTVSWIDTQSLPTLNVTTLSLGDTAITANANEINTLDNPTLTTEAGAGITAGVGTVYKSSVRTVGGIITTRILIDITGLHSEATDLDIIGVDASASAAHIGRITADQNGLILGGIMRCLEVPAGGDPNIALYSAAEGTGVEDGGIAALTEAIVFDPAADWTIDMSRSITGMPAANDYLYLVQGDASGTDADYTAGKFLIEFYGY